MKTKTLRLPVFFASAGALICTVATARADSSWSQSTTSSSQTSSEYPTASRFYPTIPGQGTSYIGRGYFTGSGSVIDPDRSNDYLMHMYQRGKQPAMTLDHQLNEAGRIVVYKTVPQPGVQATAMRTSSSSSSWVSSASTSSSQSSGGNGNVFTTQGTTGWSGKESSGTERKDSEPKEQKENKQDQNQNQDQSRNDLNGQSAASSDLQKSEPEKSSSDVSKESAGAQPSSSTSSSTESSSTSSESKTSTDVNAPAGAAAAGSLPDKVQSALKEDASLSGAAQDVKVSMNGDKLEVKGTVKSQDEKDRILEKVKSTAGSSTEIDDELKVSSDSSSPDNK